MVGVDAIPFVDRVANACIVYCAYLWKMFLPTDLAVLYPASSNISAAWPVAAMGLLVLSALSIWAGQRRPYILVGWFWYLGMLVPVIGLVQVGRQSMADRYTYVPLIGIFIIIAFGTADLLNHWQSRQRALLVSSGLAIMACIWLTRIQLQYWSSSQALWEHTISVTGENPAAHFNLGADLEEAGKVDEAMQHYSEAIRIEPTYADAHFNLGNALMKSAKPEKMEESGRHLVEALRLKPDFPEAHNGRGVHYLLQGKLEEATSHFSQAIHLKPDYAIARNNLGSALGNQGRVADAIAEYSEAVRLDPDYAEAHTNLGVLLARQGNTAEAITHLSMALRLNANNPVARNLLDGLRSKNP
jgi:Flp pilus assembly protein TadD